MTSRPSPRYPHTMPLRGAAVAGPHARTRRRVGGVAVGVYAAGMSIVTLAGLGTLAAILGEPLLFPSLGPTVMVLAERPDSASARPCNVMVGHVVGVAAGVVSLLVFGLWQAPSVTVAGVDAPRVAAAALSLALTTFVLQLARAPHAPAGATTLIVSLGLMTSLSALLAICAAVGLVTVVATVANRLVGVRAHEDVDR